MERYAMIPLIVYDLLVNVSLFLLPMIDCYTYADNVDLPHDSVRAAVAR